MKFLQRITALFVVLLLLTAMVPMAFAAENDNGVNFTEVNETVYANTSVNVRTGPSTYFDILDMLYYGETIQRVGIGDNGWSKVLYNGDYAYMYTEYLSKGTPAMTDDSQLSLQISMATSLWEGNYTAESWNVLTEAIAQAKEALESNDQEKMDNCQKALEEAMLNLVEANRADLQESLEAAAEFAASDPNNDVWFELMDAVEQGKELLGSNDQEAINAAAAKIDALLAEVKAVLEELNTPKVITQEVQVEVPPTDDYCNIPVHRVWPVVFFCSLAVNVALGAIIIVYVSRKKRNRRDDTPLVDYDIDDDIF